MIRLRQIAISGLSTEMVRGDAKITRKSRPATGNDALAGKHWQPRNRPGLLPSGIVVPELGTFKDNSLLIRRQGWASNRPGAGDPGSALWGAVAGDRPCSRKFRSSGNPHDTKCTQKDLGIIDPVRNPIVE